MPAGLNGINELVARDGSSLSRFAFGLPYDPAPLRSWAQAPPTSAEAISVERVRLATERGPYIVYRGVLRLDGLATGGDALELSVELPYAAPDPLERFDLSPNVPVPLGFVAERDLETIAVRDDCHRRSHHCRQMNRFSASTASSFTLSTAA